MGRGFGVEVVVAVVVIGTYLGSQKHTGEILFQGPSVGVNRHGFRDDYKIGRSDSFPH